MDYSKTQNLEDPVKRGRSRENAEDESSDVCKFFFKIQLGLNNIFNLLLETTHEFLLLVLQRKVNTEKHVQQSHKYRHNILGMETPG